VQVKNNVVMRVLPRENEEVNECWISDKERFSYEALNSPARLTRPMIRVDGALREVEWNVALDYVAHALKDIRGSSGGESVACSGVAAGHAGRALSAAEADSWSGFRERRFSSAAA
jgi:NADH-quinone oxidoreductase subunit G